MPRFDFKGLIDHFLKIYGQAPADGMFEIPMMGMAYAPPPAQNESEAPDGGEWVAPGGED
jgi:hypothetical protein